MKVAVDLKFTRGQNVFVNIGKNVICGKIMDAEGIFEEQNIVSYLVCTPKPGAQVRQAASLEDERYFNWIWKPEEKVFASYEEAESSSI